MLGSPLAPRAMLGAFALGRLWVRCSRALNGASLGVEGCVRSGCRAPPRQGDVHRSCTVPASVRRPLGRSFDEGAGSLGRGVLERRARAHHCTPHLRVPRRRQVACLTTVVHTRCHTCHSGDIHTGPVRRRYERRRKLVTALSRAANVLVLVCEIAFCAAVSRVWAFGVSFTVEFFIQGSRTCVSSL